MAWSVGTKRVRIVLLAILLMILPPMGGESSDAPIAARVSAQGDTPAHTLFFPLATTYQPEPFCRPAPLVEVPETEALETEALEAEVLGGRESAVDGWRCVAAIIYRGEPNVYLGQYCGGTLIAPRWVLTAAHCVDSLTPDDVDVVLGRHRLVQTGGEQIHAERFVVHPQFSRDTNRNDIALILLERESRYQPAQMVDPDDVALIDARDEGVVVGWGRAEFGYPYELREADVPVVSNLDCNELWFGLVTDHMICAGQLVPKYAGACFGDSGGPLFMRNMRGDGWEQIGIVSWGNAYCQGNYSVYTRLNQYTDWVQEGICLHTPTDSLCQGDAYESDDTRAAAGLIEANGEYQKRYFHDAGDTDWVRWEAEAGIRYRIETSYLGYRSDTVIDLYDADGRTRLDGDDNSGGGSASSLTWTAPFSQTYYVRVRHKGKAHGLNTAYYLSLRSVP